MIAGIYKLENKINGKIYIGQSINLIKRLRQYKNIQCKGQTKIYNALKHYGWANFIVEILYQNDIEKITMNTLNELEEYFIKTHKS